MQLESVLILAMDVVKGPYVHCAAPAGYSLVEPSSPLTAFASAAPPSRAREHRHDAARYDSVSTPAAACSNGLVKRIKGPSHVGSGERAEGKENAQEARGVDEGEAHRASAGVACAPATTSSASSQPQVGVDRMSGLSDVFVPRPEFCHQVMWLHPAESGRLYLYYPEEIPGEHYQRRTLRYSLCFVFCVDDSLMTIGESLTRWLIQPYSIALKNVMEELREAEMKYGYMSEGLEGTLRRARGPVGDAPHRSHCPSLTTLPSFAAAQHSGGESSGASPQGCRRSHNRQRGGAIPPGGAGRGSITDHTQQHPQPPPAGETEDGSSPLHCDDSGSASGNPSFDQPHPHSGAVPTASEPNTSNTSGRGVRPGSHPSTASPTAPASYVTPLSTMSVRRVSTIEQLAHPSPPQQQQQQPPQQHQQQAHATSGLFPPVMPSSPSEPSIATSVVNSSATGQTPLTASTSRREAATVASLAAATAATEDRRAWLSILPIDSTASATPRTTPIAEGRTTRELSTPPTTVSPFCSGMRSISHHVSGENAQRAARRQVDSVDRDSQQTQVQQQHGGNGRPPSATDGAVGGAGGGGGGAHRHAGTSGGSGFASVMSHSFSGRGGIGLGGAEVGAAAAESAPGGNGVGAAGGGGHVLNCFVTPSTGHQWTPLEDLVRALYDCLKRTEREEAAAAAFNARQLTARQRPTRAADSFQVKRRGRRHRRVREGKRRNASPSPTRHGTKTDRCAEAARERDAPQPHPGSPASALPPQPHGTHTSHPPTPVSRAAVTTHTARHSISSPHHARHALHPLTLPLPHHPQRQAAVLDEGSRIRTTRTTKTESQLHEPAMFIGHSSSHHVDTVVPPSTAASGVFPTSPIDPKQRGSVHASIPSSHFDVAAQHSPDVSHCDQFALQLLQRSGAWGGVGSAPWEAKGFLKAVLGPAAAGLVEGTDDGDGDEDDEEEDGDGDEGSTTRCGGSGCQSGSAPDGTARMGGMPGGNPASQPGAALGTRRVALLRLLQESTDRRHVKDQARHGGAKTNSREAMESQQDKCATWLLLPPQGNRSSSSSSSDASSHAGSSSFSCSSSDEELCDSGGGERCERVTRAFRETLRAPRDHTIIYLSDKIFIHVRRMPPLQPVDFVHLDQTPIPIVAYDKAAFECMDLAVHRVFQLVDGQRTVADIIFSIAAGTSSTLKEVFAAVSRVDAGMAAAAASGADGEWNDSATRAPQHAFSSKPIPRRKGDDDPTSPAGPAAATMTVGVADVNSGSSSNNQVRKQGHDLRRATSSTFVVQLAPSLTTTGKAGLATSAAATWRGSHKSTPPPAHGAHRLVSPSQNAPSSPTSPWPWQRGYHGRSGGGRGGGGGGSAVKTNAGAAVISASARGTAFDTAAAATGGVSVVSVGGSVGGGGGGSYASTAGPGNGYPSAAMLGGGTAGGASAPLHAMPSPRVHVSVLPPVVVEHNNIKDGAEFDSVSGGSGGSPLLFNAEGAPADARGSRHVAGGDHNPRLPPRQRRILVELPQCWEAASSVVTEALLHLKSCHVIKLLSPWNPHTTTYCTTSAFHAIMRDAGHPARTEMGVYLLRAAALEKQDRDLRTAAQTLRRQLRAAQEGAHAEQERERVPLAEGRQEEPWAVSRSQRRTLTPQEHAAVPPLASDVLGRHSRSSATGNSDSNSIGLPHLPKAPSSAPLRPTTAPRMQTRPPPLSLVPPPHSPKSPSSPPAGGDLAATVSAVPVTASVDNQATRMPSSQRQPLHIHGQPQQPQMALTHGHSSLPTALSTSLPSLAGTPLLHSVSFNEQRGGWNLTLATGDSSSSSAGKRSRHVQSGGGDGRHRLPRHVPRRAAPRAPLPAEQSSPCHTLHSASAVVGESREHSTATSVQSGNFFTVAAALRESVAGSERHSTRASDRQRHCEEGGGAGAGFESVGDDGRMDDSDGVDVGSAPFRSSSTTSSHSSSGGSSYSSSSSSTSASSAPSGINLTNPKAGKPLSSSSSATSSSLSRASSRSASSVAWAKQRQTTQAGVDAAPPCEPHETSSPAHPTRCTEGGSPLAKQQQQQRRLEEKDEKREGKESRHASAPHAQAHHADTRFSAAALASPTPPPLPPPPPLLGAEDRTRAFMDHLFHHCTREEVRLASSAAICALGKLTNSTMAAVRAEMRLMPAWGMAFNGWSMTCCKALVEMGVLNGWLQEVGYMPRVD